MTDMTLAEKGQVTASAAEIYDRRFVPALFGQFAPRLVAFAGVAPGTRVLDAATGTGIVALAAAGAGADVTGLDINPGMLAVARRKSAAIDWVEGDVAALPFPDAAFDTVLCQFALMFVPDRPQALAEMLRVLKPGGTLAVAVFDALERTPAYCDLVPLLGRIVGPGAAEALSAPFVLGDAHALAAEIGAAGATVARVEAVTGTARHPSLDAWLDTEIGGWTISEMVSEGQLAALKEAAHRLFARHEAADGTASFPAPAHFIAARR